jgi:hypothetical protein
MNAPFSTIKCSLAAVTFVLISQQAQAHRTAADPYYVPIRIPHRARPTTAARVCTYSVKTPFDSQDSTLI